MQRLVFLFALFFLPCFGAYCEHAKGIAGERQKAPGGPKLVVGIVVDQMRWDFLYRYYDRYAPEGGFRRLLNEGFSCENTMIPYTPTITACGHASIFTGSTPAVNGITGNDWWDYGRAKLVYCTDDDSVQTIGNNTAAGRMSPKNLAVSTIGDELRLATNFRSKVVGISLKDRGAILPAGHSANAAYWYSTETGDWISSDYYVGALPAWVAEINAKRLADKYFQQGWSTLYPVETYTQSSTDDQPYETRPFGSDTKGFPYDLKQFVGKNHGLLPVTPFGNSVTFEMARAAITGEQLGVDSITDLLTISLSSPDYIGHNFGPNSMEAEDCYLRLDKDLGEFLAALDREIGAGEYLVFLTADHGGAAVPAFLKTNKIPAGNVDGVELEQRLNRLLSEKFRKENLVIGIINYQVYLNRVAIEEARLDNVLIHKELIRYLLNEPGIADAFALDALSASTLPEPVKTAAQNGYYPSRSGDIQLVLMPQWIEGFMKKGTTHGVWNPYDSHIPLLWFGWNIAKGKTNSSTYVTDIAPTLASMLHIQMPNGSVGKVIKSLSR